MKYNKIVKLDLELSQQCFVSCPMCPRTDDNLEEQEFITKKQLTLDEIKNFVSDYDLSLLKKITICGNYGEPIIAKDCLKIVQYFREKNPNVFIQISTCGGAKSADWWRDLAKSIGKNGVVQFHIDGLEDTNHIYRRGINWKKIVTAYQSYIGAGGRAHWIFIPFKHNEHQVFQAAKIAREEGFEEFKLKVTTRFLGKDYRSYKNGEVKLYKSIYNIQLFEANFKKSFFCDSHINKYLYLGADGKVSPCCYILPIIDQGSDSERKSYPNFGEKNTVKNRKIQDYIDNDLFTEIIVDDNQNVQSPTLGCIKACGKKNFRQFITIYKRGSYFIRSKRIVQLALILKQFYRQLLHISNKHFGKSLSNIN